MAPGQSAALRAILVVEDEMLLRMRAVDMVEDAGFTAVEAINADDALAVLESRSDIELLFTDIQMPGSMDGLKLAYAVHARWPSIKIILVSGQLNLTDDDKPPDSRFFGKPLDVKQMIAEMQDMIGKGSLKIAPDDISALIAKASHPELNGKSIRPGSAGATSQVVLTVENDSLRLLLEQARIHAKGLLAQAGIDPKEHQTAHKFHNLIL